MIGFYDYTVILTYVSLASSVLGMMEAVNGKFKTAVFFLALSGLCDMFDGKVARSKKNRTEDEKHFGIQLDSLCDVVCFGAFPIVLAYCIGVNSVHGVLVLVFYGIASVIRLAYFNVVEERRQSETTENRKYYQGLPITSIAIVLPLFFLTRPFLKWNFVTVLEVVMGIVGLLFIVNFKVKKPGNTTLAVLVLIVGLAVLRILHII